LEDLGKRCTLKDGGVFLALQNATFLSDDFSKLPRAKQLAELGVDQIPGKSKFFSPLDDNLPSLYEMFIKGGGF
jgi:hypothetical protein